MGEFLNIKIHKVSSSTITAFIYFESNSAHSMFCKAKLSSTFWEGVWSFGAMSTVSQP